MNVPRVEFSDQLTNQRTFLMSDNKTKKAEALHSPQKPYQRKAPLFQAKYGLL